MPPRRAVSACRVRPEAPSMMVHPGLMADKENRPMPWEAGGTKRVFRVRALLAVILTVTASALVAVRLWPRKPW